MIEFIVSKIFLTALAKWIVMVFLGGVMGGLIKDKAYEFGYEEIKCGIFKNIFRKMLGCGICFIPYLPYIIIVFLLVGIFGNGSLTEEWFDKKADWRKIK